MVAGIIIIIAFSILPLIITGAFKRVPNQRKITGTIHSIEFSHYDHNFFEDVGSNQYYYYVQYFVDGKEYLLKTKYTSSITNVERKKRIVKYNLKNPKQAIICPDAKIYLFSLTFLIIGIYIICSIIINNDSNGCCACLDCPQCDVCCDCTNPYLTNK